MGSAHCSCCGTEQPLEVPSTKFRDAFAGEASPEIDNSIWGEVFSETSRSSTSRDPLAVSSAAKSQGQHSRLRLLEFDIKTLDEEVGLELQILAEPETALVVMSVEPKCPLRRAIDGNPGVCPGDIIAEVGHVGGSPERLMTELRRIRSFGGCFTMSVLVRPKLFSVDLVREGSSWQRLGLTVALKPDRGFLLVAAVHEAGLAHDWNMKHSQACICAGDRITHVNGKSGDAIEMYAIVQSTPQRGSLKLVVETPARKLVPLLEAWKRRDPAEAESSGEHLEML